MNENTRPTKKDFSRVMKHEKWKKMIRVRKTTDVGVCTTCLDFEDEVRALDLRTQVDELAEVRRRRVLHWEEWTGARRLYRERVSKWVLGESDWASCVMDAAENNKTSLVLEHTNRKGGLAPALKVKTKVQGILYHGLGLFLSTVFEHLGTGGNMAITVLYNFLTQLRDVLDPKTPVPTKLCVQVDGGSENWNRTMFAFLAWLVRIGAFKEVRLCRLPPGHSHTDIDGRWGNLSAFVRGNAAGRGGINIYSLAEFQAALKKCFGDELLFSEDLKFVWDFEKWLGNVLHEKTFGGHAPGHAYRYAFGKSSNVMQFRAGNEIGDVLFRYKVNYTAEEDADWLPGDYDYGDGKTFPEGFLFVWPDDMAAAPEVEQLHLWKEMPIIREQFMAAFVAGCGKYQAEATGVDYGAIWEAWFDSLPKNLDDVFGGADRPVFINPHLGERAAISVEVKQEREKVCICVCLSLCC